MLKNVSRGSISHGTSPGMQVPSDTLWEWKFCGQKCLGDDSSSLRLPDTLSA